MKYCSACQILDALFFLFQGTALVFNMPAPLGNKNASKENRQWGNAVHRSLVQGEQMRKAADALVAKAIEGDVAALRELGDRIDGKVPQALTGADGDALIPTLVRVLIVDGTDDKSSPSA